MAVMRFGRLAKAVGLGLALVAGDAGAQPWFGLRQPQGLSDPLAATAPFNAYSYGTLPPPHPMPAGGPLSGGRILQDVTTIVGFSRERRDAGDPLWGRISGLPGELKTIDWAVARLREAGLSDVRAEPFALPRPQWVPKRWEVRLLADPQYGAGSRDIVLGSAFPQPESPGLPPAGLTAPLVFVGGGAPAELARLDLKGKVAVLHVTPKPALLYSEGNGAAQRLVDRGAAGVINVIESPGNMHYVDPRFGCRNAPCFSVGGEDGAFLEQLLAKTPAPSVRLALESDMPAGQTAANGVAMVKGRTDRNILIIAHADGWFDGATDNADGLAMLLAQARHFAKARPVHNLIFVVTAGHHGPGNGPNAFMAAHPDVMSRTVLVVNLEHLSQVDLVATANTKVADGGFANPPIPSVVEIAKKLGVSNQSPFLVAELGKASREYGMITGQLVSSSVPGDGGGFVRHAPVVNLIGSGIFYHSSGDTLATISRNGLERAAGFFADFIKTVDEAPEAKLAAGPDAPPARDPSLMPATRP